MPRVRSEGWVPKYRHHRSSRQAYVRLDGHDHWLGLHGSAESKIEYRRLVAEWMAGTVSRPPMQAVGAATSVAPVTKDITIAEAIAAFRKHAEAYYPPRTAVVLRAALRRLRLLYGDTPVRAFGAPAMKTVIDSMVRETEPGEKTSTLCRTTVNDYCARIRQFLRWGVGEGIVPVQVWEAVRAVPGLRRGRSTVREKEPVGPVADDIVERTLPHLLPVVADMIRVQRLTGMRPAEVCRMTNAELDTSGPAWLYRPRHHKSAHRGAERVVAIGPKAQAILRRYLRPALDQPLFQPEESERLRHAQEHEQRATPMTPSQIERAKQSRRRLRRRPPGRSYSPDSYRRAVTRACARAGVTAWCPNQLRHTRATELRRTHGLDVAGAVLGHAKLETTQVYAERNLEIAAAAALATG